MDNPAKLNQLSGLIATLAHVVMGTAVLSFLLSKSTSSIQPFFKAEFRNTELLGVSLLHILVSAIQTAGLVTMEDILEEIVGKIQDEY